MEAGKNSVTYMGLISGPNKADDTCGATTVTGTTDIGFTVLRLMNFSDDKNEPGKQMKAMTNCGK
jgi:hypothetical protein